MQPNHPSHIHSSRTALRVLLWAPQGSGLHYGGPGMSAFRLYNKDDEGRFKVTLAHGRANHAHYKKFESQHMIYPVINGSRWMPSASKQYQFYRQGRHWVKEHAGSYDVFHGLQGFDWTVGPAIAAHEAGLPAVVKLAAHRAELIDKPGWRKLLGRPRYRRRAIAQIDAIIAISTDIRDELRSYDIPDEKIIMIPNGVDTDQFSPVADKAVRQQLRHVLGWPDRPTILFVGTLIPRKRPHLLIEALAQLRRQGSDAQLVLAGPETDPQYVAQMRRTADDGGVTDRVIWSGFNPEIAPLYRAADAFALPSIKEGMPNALLEAMASGLPCLATDISGSRDLVTHEETGMIAEPNVPAITHALSQLLGDSATHLGQAARQLIGRAYSTDVVLNMHDKLFRQIMRGR